MQRETVIIRDLRIPIFPDQMSPLIIEVLRGGVYERDEAEKLKKMIEPGEVILEVGGGIGFVSALASMNRNTARVETFEANPELKPLIETVHRINQIESTTIHTGVLIHQPAENTVPFYIRDDFWASSLDPLTYHARTVDVPTHDLNTTLRRIRPTMIICDIEGGELDLFEHADLDGVRKVLVEIHRDVLGRAGIKRIFDAFSAKGFHYDPSTSAGQVVSFSHVSREPYPQWIPARQRRQARMAESGASVEETKPPVGVIRSGLHDGARYHVHLGAHQTATRFIRDAIEQNRGGLAECGIDFWSLPATRENLTLPIRETLENAGTVSVEDLIARIGNVGDPRESSAIRRTVISDEGLMGKFPRAFRQGIYGSINKRLKMTREALGDDAKAFLVVRDYADFIPAIYWESIVSRGYFPFEKFLEKSSAIGFSWTRVCAKIVETFGTGNVEIIEFETLVSHPEKAVLRLLGANLELSIPRSPKVYQPSGGAVEYVRIEREWKSGRMPSEVAKAARARFPVHKGHAPFDPWTPQQRADLTAKYLSDLEKIGVMKSGKLE